MEESRTELTGSTTMGRHGMRLWVADESEETNVTIPADPADGNATRPGKLVAVGRNLNQKANGKKLYGSCRIRDPRLLVFSSSFFVVGWNDPTGNEHFTRRLRN